MTADLPGRPRWATPEDEPYLAYPKITLHDHLDGAILPETMLELAEAQGVRLPYADGERLAWWFNTRDAEPLEEFPHQKFWFTTALMQDPESLERVAYEWALDVVADGVLYGEVRWAPEKHVRSGMSMREAVDAVAVGLAQGEQAAAAAGKEVRLRQLLCGMRETELSAEVARLAVETHGEAVAGYDIAGPEAGHPARDHVEACRLLHEAGVPYTIHAGEGDGIRSLWEAVHLLHALRLGHGIRIVEDIRVDGEPLDVRTTVATVAAAGGVEALTGRIELGPVARWVLDRRIPLEVCPTSNSRWVVPGFEHHPVDLLARLGFVVTLNPDNRMMSQTCVSGEMRKLRDVFRWGPAEFGAAQLAAVEGAFLAWEDKQALRGRVAEGLSASEEAAA